MKSGYCTAIELAAEKLKTLDISGVCARTGAKWDGINYLVPWLGSFRAVSEGTPAQQVLWLHYLISEAAGPSGDLIPFRDIPGVRGYEPVFTARAVRPLIKKFGKNAGGLLEAARAVNGTKAAYGDCAVTVPCFPGMPVTYILWEGDDELPADGSILFDRAAATRLPAEDLVVLASLCAYELISKAV